MHDSMYSVQCSGASRCRPTYIEITLDTSPLYIIILSKFLAKLLFLICLYRMAPKAYTDSNGVSVSLSAFVHNDSEVAACNGGPSYSYWYREITKELMVAENILQLKNRILILRFRGRVKPLSHSVIIPRLQTTFYHCGLIDHKLIHTCSCILSACRHNTILRCGSRVVLYTPAPPLVCVQSFLLTPKPL